MTTGADRGNDSDEAEDTRKNSFREWVGILWSLALVVLAGALFCLGREYIVGFGWHLGLNASDLAEDFYGYLYWGFFAAKETLRFVKIKVLLGAAVLAIAGFVLVYANGQKGNSKSRFAKPMRAIRPHSALLACALSILSIAYILFFTQQAIGTSFMRGVGDGDKEITRVSTRPGDFRWIELHFADCGGRVERGYRLHCTDRLCSIYDPAAGERLVRVILLDGLKEIKVFEARPRSAST
jgi:hypothetical protein